MENKNSNQIDIVVLVVFFLLGYIFLIVASHNHVEHRFSYLAGFLILYGIWGILRKKIFIRDGFESGIFAIVFAVLYIIIGVILIFVLKKY